MPPRKKPDISLSYLQSVMKRYRNRLGINPSYEIHLEIVPEHKWPKKLDDAGAWVKESDTHPWFEIKLRKSYLQEKENNPRQITQLIVHELLHIVLGEILKDLKRNYNYDQDGKIEEKLVMQMARAIVPAKED